MKKYCLDSNTILTLFSIYKEGTIKWQQQKNIEQKIKEIGEKNICITDIVKYEIINAQSDYKGLNYEMMDEYQQGMLKIFGKRNNFIKKVNIYSLDEKAIKIYKITKFPNKKDKNDHCDFLIASICLANNLIIVSNDKCFSFIDGLKYEDWFN